MAREKTERRGKTPGGAGAGISLEKESADEGVGPGAKLRSLSLEHALELSDKIIDTVREGMLVLDNNLRIIRVNQSFYKRFKVGPAETIGRQIYDLGDGQWNIPELRKLLEEVLPKNNSFNDYVVEHEFDSIGRRVMLLNGRRVDEIQQILLAVEDITDRHGAVRTLEESEERLRLATEAAQVGIWEWDLGTDEVNWTEMECRLVGCDPVSTNATVQAFFERVHPDDLPVLSEAVNRAIEKGDDYDVEFRVIHPDGQVRWLAGKGEVYRDEDGKPSRMMGINFDITDRKQAELELKQTRDELTDFIENATIGLHWVGPDGTILWANRKELELLGYEEKEYVGRHISEFHVKQEVIEDILNRLGSFEELHGYESQMVCKDGSIKDVLIDSSVYQEDGVFIHTRCFTRDVTSRKQAEEALHRLNETLEQQVFQRTEMLKLLQDITRAANEAQTVEEAMRAALDRIIRFNIWQVGHVWHLADDNEEQMVSSGIWYVSDEPRKPVDWLDELRRISEQARFSSGEGLIGAVMESGEPRWVDNVHEFADWRRNGVKRLELRTATAFPITVGDKVVAVLEFFSDQPTKRKERFMEIMPDVGIQLGHVIERKWLEKTMADAVANQQRHIGRELHDSVQQQLTGTRMIAERLKKDLLEAGSPSAESAGKIVQLLIDASEQTRRLSHGLAPVEVDAEGLMTALQELVDHSDKMYESRCLFRCHEKLTVANSNAATHLYRIAQEAIQNAVKHANPSRIEVVLETDDKFAVLSVLDDGDGMREPESTSNGTGIRIMRYRANLIGARLDIESKDGQGVSVRCRVRRKA